MRRPWTRPSRRAENRKLKTVPDLPEDQFEANAKLEAPRSQLTNRVAIRTPSAAARPALADHRFELRTLLTAQPHHIPLYRPAPCSHLRLLRLRVA